MCNAERPVVTAAQQHYEGQVRVVRINTNRRDAFLEFGVPSQPSWAFINDDGTVSVQLTSFEQDEIFARIDDLIAS